jgi:hypothetical protein
MDEQKKQFVLKDSLLLFKKIQPAQPGKWGKMNGQQMVEHVTAFFMVSTGKLRFDLVTPEEHLPKYREFLYGNKEFRENTKAPGNVIGDDALPLRNATIEEALEKLEAAIAAFKDYFSANSEIKTTHPVFGELNYAEWILLHYKHVTHHLRQFNLL